MEGGTVFDNSTSVILLQNDQNNNNNNNNNNKLPPPISSSSSSSPPPSCEVLDSLWVSNNHSSMVNFDQKNLEDENGNEDYDGDGSGGGRGGCFHQPEKKRRLMPEQVKFLERTFDVENKLEPERKIQLAKELGLQPRQVAIWFQNRRARFKTKQLERDYGGLKSNYDKLKVAYESLSKENDKLKNEVHLLTEKLLLGEKGKKVKMEPSDFVRPEPQKTTTVVCKQEDASSAKSDVFDSDSPHYTDGNHSSLLEAADDSSHIFEPDLSDFSQEEDDRSLTKSFLGGGGGGGGGPASFPNLEDECYNNLQADSSMLVEDPATWFWDC